MKTLRKHNRFTIASLLLACTLACSLALASCTNKDEETPVHGKLHALASESQASVLQAVGDEFRRLYPEVSVRVTPASTRDAIVKFLNDSIRFICVDRALNAEERAFAERRNFEFVEVRVAEDALAFIVHADTPVTRLTQQSIRDIASGAVSDWSALPSSRGRGPILLAMTGRNSGTYELLTRHFLKLPGDATLAFLADSQRAVAEFVSGNPRALGVVSLAVLRDSIKHIRPVDVEYIDTSGTERAFVQLHQANIYQERYAYHFPVYIYFKASDRGVPSGFSSFITSAPGQKVFLYAGLVPRTQPVRLVKLNEEEEE